MRSPRGCRWPARVMRRPGRSMSSRVSSRMAFGPGGVHGRQRDGQPLGGSHGRLPGSLDLLSGHRQHGAPGAPAAAEVPGGVGERQAVSFREPEQRAQRGDGVVAPVTAQRLQDGVDVSGGDLPQVAACCCPVVDEGPHDTEANPHGGGRPGASAGVTVEQHHQPGTDVAAEPGRQLADAAVDPAPDRRGGVVEQQPPARREPQRSWWLSCGCVAAPARPPATAEPGHRRSGRRGRPSGRRTPQ